MVRHALSLLAATAGLAAVGPVAAQEPAQPQQPRLTSGIDVGAPVPAFNPTHVWGPDRGTTACPP
ncbi:MAG TPA: hypothetical protein VLH79_04300 [Chthonomonadales bacterium]|nr:hypothetical protein [Chthonomonadales bacterium]